MGGWVGGGGTWCTWLVQVSTVVFDLNVLLYLGRKKDVYHRLLIR